MAQDDGLSRLRYDDFPGNAEAMMDKAIDKRHRLVATTPWLALALAALALPAVVQAAPADCEALRTAYRAAVPAAQVCDAKRPKSCAAVRPAALDDACHCQVSVNPKRTQQLDRLLADYRAQGCVTPLAVCNRMCTAPVSACTRAASGAQARCSPAR